MHQYLKPSEGIDFKSFLETGQLGRLNSKPSIKEVYQVLGQPISVEQDTKAIHGSILTRVYFDNMEVRFIDDTFYQLAIYFRENDKINSFAEHAALLTVSWYSAVSKMSFKEIVEFLQSNNVGCRRIVFSESEDDAGLAIEIIATGVWISFSDFEKVECIHHTPSRPGYFEYMAL